MSIPAGSDAPLARLALPRRPASRSWCMRARPCGYRGAAAQWGGVSAVVLHSFSSGPSLFAAGMDVGAYFSFSGMITFKSWADQASLTTCPIDRLLVETDAPYLAPVPHRGCRNEPAYVRDVAERLALRRGASFEDIARHTTENARRVFRRPDRHHWPGE
jgi:Tat protein secretion system quality control protein TatD with DNase activity